jgi:hypothetical protein
MLKQELAWIKWLQPGALEPLADDHGYTLAQVALMQAACLFVHQFLHRKDKYAYTLNRIRQTVLKHPEVSQALVDYFESRFHPHEEHREHRVQTARTLATKMLDSIPQELEQSILQHILQFMDHVLKTNYYVENRFGLGFRINPDMLQDLFEGDIPYGIFFFLGPRYHGFHVRYRDMARGGVRIVRTRNKEHFELENARLFDEATALASSQQLKNKDIPEGGSKAVLLLEPQGSVDLAVKSMTNTLLDMIISTPQAASSRNVVDYLGHHEIIYLGPDENILPRHIQWIVQRAEKRGYPWARAIVEGANIFISREARDHLQEAGVVFLHGSSANKTGVICSSYEILAGLILSDEEFLAIKKEYVAQVLAILEHRARSEARMLTREFRYAGGKTPMTEISFAASREINELGDMISNTLAEHVSDLHNDPDLCELILDYCPPVLVDKYRERIISHIPVRHQFALLGAVFASSMVYREGLGWLKRISNLKNILDVIHADLKERKHLRRIERILSSSDLEDRETIVNIVKARGQRYLTTTRLGLEHEPITEGT